MDDYPEESPSAPAQRGLMLAAALMAVAGWVGLWLVVTTTLPTAFPRWLFFVLLYLAVTGTALPFVRFLHARFVRHGRELPTGAIVRQSLWIGLFVVACAWLQIPRVLNLFIALFLGSSLVVVEVFLHMREQG